MNRRLRSTSDQSRSILCLVCVLALLGACGDPATEQDGASVPVIGSDVADGGLSFDQVGAGDDTADDTVDDREDIAQDLSGQDQAADRQEDQTRPEDVLDLDDESAEDELGDALDAEHDAPPSDMADEADLADAVDLGSSDLDGADDLPSDPDVSEGDATDIATDTHSDAPDLAADRDGDGTPIGPLPEYLEYFEARSAVAEATIASLDTDSLAMFWRFIRGLEETGQIAIEEPVASQNCDAPTSCGYISLTETERTTIYVAKLAHSIWLDQNDTLPWHLVDYTAEELRGLFDRDLLFHNGNGFNSVVDYSPSYAYGYVTDRGLVGETMEATLEAVVAELRTTDSDRDFIHGLAAHGDPTNTAYTLEEALETYTDRGGPVRISRRGCHSMSRIVLALLRSVNIPGLETHAGEWYLDRHSSAVWPILERVLTHGDNVYSALITAGPTLDLTPPTAIFDDEENIAVCGEDRYCLAMRHSSQVGMAYPSSYTRNRCCRPEDFSEVSCEAYLTDNYSAYLTTDEISNAVLSIEATCD